MSSWRSGRQVFVSSNALWCRVAITDDCGTTVASWTLGGVGAPDFGVVDRIARLQVDATRRGQTLRLSQVCPDLVALIEFAGLADVLATPRG
jgi:hypothetical protein